ncbi:hypothetical protein AHAS_Ahas05G0124900 [Arachis hypogaea]
MSLSFASVNTASSSVTSSPSSPAQTSARPSPTLKPLLVTYVGSSPSLKLTVLPRMWIN